MRSPSRAGAALVVLFVAGCGEPERSTADQARPIVGGVPDSTDAHRAVVALTNGPGTISFCTATLIAPSVVLTAAHCVEEDPPRDIWVFFGDDVFGAGELIPAEESEMFPSYDPDLLVDDIGLLRMAGPAPAGVAPIAHLPFAEGITGADEGETVEFVGYGIDESGDGDVKLRVGSTLDLLCPGPDECDFLGFAVNPWAFAYTMDPGGPCDGDSGGPALILRGQREYVAGITSYGDGPCTVFGVSNLVDPYQDWIDDFIARGAPVPLERCANQADDDGDGRVDCDDPDCAASLRCAAPKADGGGGCRQSSEGAGVWWLIFLLAGSLRQRRTARQR